MIVESILGHLNDFDVYGREVDYVDVEWYEVSKKVLKKDSKAGKEIGIKQKGEQRLNHNDVLYYDSEEIVIVNIPECEAILIKPKTIEEMGRVCYEIGNKHVQLFLHDNEVRVPYEEPLMKLLDKKGFNPKKVTARLTNGLECHSHEH
ncbi:urease accessory protein UreE [Clostridium sp. DJ247]|uniref:urease accessory protein UreE n=1 Tax=Clostridium sp. DJ247 TaxID=2726188 RepID=UPI001625D427|nr:urease accessory protein UreE [Clostridium sp. DJ247]MBC2581209.1 urease accessory protein UreE [Clostridium sp. DJ247]